MARIDRNPVWEVPRGLWAQIEPILRRGGSVKATAGSQMSTRAPNSEADGNRFYITASDARLDDRTQVLKHGETFAVLDHSGDVRPGGLGEQGIYHEGTRYLSALDLRLADHRPLLLGSFVKDHNALLAVDLTNPDFYQGSRLVAPRGTLHILRCKFLWHGCCYERLLVSNYGLARLHVQVVVDLAADFRDIFEVRGQERERHGEPLPPVYEDSSLVFAYRGLDGVERRTRVEFSPSPDEVVAESGLACFEMTLDPKAAAKFYITVRCESRPAPREGRDAREARLVKEAGLLDAGLVGGVYRRSHGDAMRELREALDRRGTPCSVVTSSAPFNDWLNRSSDDLRLMTTETPHGPYPYAGVPWFSTAFGRDGIITALENLWVDPSIARGVLAFLAANQASEIIAEQDAEPGKILHETRKGEMAALGEIPFGRYYGSVDSTPLFVLLAGAYYERTADLEFVRTLWPNVERALEWIERYGDPDGDGFVEYQRHSEQGLIHQGWKDSHDSVFHADGSPAEGPIALCEVQGYVYAAKRAAGRIAAALGMPQRAGELEDEAAELARRFDEPFWCEDLGTYALALDGSKQPCRVRTSNPGHCLATGIVAEQRAARVAETLLAEDSFSGWGIRTVAAGEARYNPMSYHNGSIWPHDNALAAYGLGRYGFKRKALRVLTGLFDVSLFVDLHRMPELFCGFARRPHQGPTLYPVACAPQSWAAAAVFMLLEACLGLQIDAPRRRMYFRRPLLPESLERVSIRNLAVGEASVDLDLARHADDVAFNVVRREGEVEVMLVK